jgi:hypothetical protein
MVLRLRSLVRAAVLEAAGLSVRDNERIAARVLLAAQEPVRAQDLKDMADLDGRPLGTVLRCLRYEGRRRPSPATA